jgi:hypothetical protein
VVDVRRLRNDGRADSRGFPARERPAGRAVAVGRARRPATQRAPEGSPTPNIDPLYFLTPAIVLGFSVGLVVYWRQRRHFTRWTLLASLVAYASAIAAKEVVQFATLGWVESTTSGNPALLGAYYGAQTAAFEVGGAFLVAAVVVALGHFDTRDAGFGIGLAFWENAVLISLPLVLDYTVYYAILSHPGSAAAVSLYPVLRQDAPALFYGPAGALPLIGYAVVERVTSLLAHSAWGYLAVLAAVRRKWTYLAVAAPIGFAVDFLVPFAGALGLARFELISFGVALIGLIAAVVVARPRAAPEGTTAPRPPGAGGTEARRARGP